MNMDLVYKQLDELLQMGRIEETEDFLIAADKDEEFMKVCKQDPSYIKWFMESVATDYTKKLLREYYSKHRSTK